MHNAHLYIDGLRIPISNFYYHFYQMTDERSKPVSRVLGGEFGFSYEPTKNRAENYLAYYGRNRAGTP